MALQLEATSSESQSTLGLTEQDVQDFQRLCSEAGISLADDDVADTARRVVVFYRTLVGRLPEDPDHEAPEGSNSDALSRLAEER
jgi:hypothetical protein